MGDGPVCTGEGQVLNVPAGSSGFQPQPSTALPPADSAVFSGTPAQAQERLAQISTTPELRDKVLAGSPALLREWQELTRVVVEAGESTPTGNIETTDSVSDPAALTRRERAGLMDAMRDQGMPQRMEDWVNLMETGQAERPSEGDGIVARKVWDRLSKSPEFQKAVLSSEPRALETMALLSGLKAFAQPDGRPISQTVRDWLARQGLR